MRAFNFFVRLCFLCLLMAFLAAYAEEPAPQGGQALDQAANDPTASLMNVQVQDVYEYNFADDYVAPKWAVNFTVKFLFSL